MRYLSQQLERAEKVLDRRLDIARQRKGEVGFVGEALESANRTCLFLDLAASNLAAWRLSRRLCRSERIAAYQDEGPCYTRKSSDQGEGGTQRSETTNIASCEVCVRLRWRRKGQSGVLGSIRADSRLAV